MRNLRRNIALVLVAATGVASAQPTGDTAGDRDRAIELFRESDAHYKRGEFERAAALLREAYAVHPEPTLLYNLARALEGLGDFIGAIDQYERYLSAAQEIPDRGAIERRIATLRAHVARVAAGEDDGAAPTPPPASDVRTEALRAPFAGPAPSRAEGGSRRAPWMIAGGGGVVLGGGALLGYLSQRRYDAAVAEPVQAEAVRLHDQARRLATGANVALVVGGVVAVGGVTWALLARRRSSSRLEPGSARLDLGPGTVTATWVFE